MPCWTIMIESALFYLALAVFRCRISIHELLEAVFFILVPCSLHPDDVARASLAPRLAWYINLVPWLSCCPFNKRLIRRRCTQWVSRWHAWRFRSRGRQHPTLRHESAPRAGGCAQQARRWRPVAFARGFLLARGAGGSIDLAPRHVPPA